MIRSIDGSDKYKCQEPVSDTSSERQELNAYSYVFGFSILLTKLKLLVMLAINKTSLTKIIFL